MLPGMKRLTTAEVARRLGVAQVTVNVWCLRGRFPGAVREETPRGPVWLISERDLKDFERPKLGRPVKLLPAKGLKKKKQ